MAIDREFRLLLEYARLPDSENELRKVTRAAKDQPTRVAVRDIYTRLQVAHQQTLLPLVGVSNDMHLPELLALLAEAAIYQRDYNTAAKTVQWFLNDCAVKNQVRYVCCLHGHRMNACVSPAHS